MLVYLGVRLRRSLLCTDLRKLKPGLGNVVVMFWYSFLEVMTNAALFLNQTVQRSTKTALSEPADVLQKFSLCSSTDELFCLHACILPKLQNKQWMLICDVDESVVRMAEFLILSKHHAPFQYNHEFKVDVYLSKLVFSSKKCLT